MSPKTKLILKTLGITAAGLATFAYMPLVAAAVAPATMGWVSTGLAALHIGQATSDILLASGIGASALALIGQSVKQYSAEKKLEKKIEQIVEQKTAFKKQQEQHPHQKKQTRPNKIAHKGRHPTQELDEEKLAEHRRRVLNPQNPTFWRLKRWLDERNHHQKAA